MKKIILLMAVLLMAATMNAQVDKPYDPGIDAMAQIDEAVNEAHETGKYVICQVGYNQCPWCIMFSNYKDTCEEVHKIIENNFVYIHVNYSKENRNPDAMDRLKNPARFGFPVFVILNSEGEVIHIQNSAYLEEGKGYSKKKVVDFLNNWTPKAVTTLK